MWVAHIILSIIIFIVCALHLQGRVELAASTTSPGHIIMWEDIVCIVFKVCVTERLRTIVHLYTYYSIILWCFKFIYFCIFELFVYMM